MSEQIVDRWPQKFDTTAVAGDLAGHLATISPEVMVFGVPGFDTLSHGDWYRQCEHGFR